MRVLKKTLRREDFASRRHCVEILSSFLNPRCAQRWLGPNLSTRERKQTQKALARFRPCHTAEQCSSEFKLGEQRGRRLRNTSLISRSNKAGSIKAVVSTEVPMGSVFVWQNGNMMITLVGVKVYSSKRVERKGVLIANTASCQR